jgi:hypothetical protein
MVMYDRSMAIETRAEGKRITVSVPGDLIGPLEEMAASEDRSVSGQIVNIIRQWAAGAAGGRRSVVVSDEEFAALLVETRDAAKRSDLTVPPTLQRLTTRSYGG